MPLQSGNAGNATWLSGSGETAAEIEEVKFHPSLLCNYVNTHDHQRGLERGCNQWVNLPEICPNEEIAMYSEL